MYFYIFLYININISILFFYKLDVKCIKPLFHSSNNIDIKVYIGTKEKKINNNIKNNYILNFLKIQHISDNRIISSLNNCENYILKSDLILVKEIFNQSIEKALHIDQFEVPIPVIVRKDNHYLHSLIVLENNSILQNKRLICFLIELTSYQSSNTIIPTRDLLKDSLSLTDTITYLFPNQSHSYKDQSRYTSELSKDVMVSVLDNTSKISHHIDTCLYLDSSHSQLNNVMNSQIDSDIIEVKINEIKNKKEINVEIIEDNPNPNYTLTLTNNNYEFEGKNENINQDIFIANTSIKYQYFKYNIHPLTLRYVDMESKTLGI